MRGWCFQRFQTNLRMALTSDAAATHAVPIFCARALMNAAAACSAAYMRERASAREQVHVLARARAHARACARACACVRTCTCTHTCANSHVRVHACSWYLAACRLHRRHPGHHLARQRFARIRMLKFGFRMLGLGVGPSRRSFPADSVNSENV